MLDITPKIVNEVKLTRSFVNQQRPGVWRRVAFLLIAIACFMHLLKGANARPNRDFDASVPVDETALDMLRDYLKTLNKPYEGIGPLEYPESGYIVIEDLKSNKRGLGPRPLRFGRR